MISSAGAGPNKLNNTLYNVVGGSLEGSNSVESFAEERRQRGL
jgi:hypothetical protein